LGGINEIEIQSDKGYVRFINKSPNQLKKVDINNISTLNIHGVIPNANNNNLEGSFIRNANVKSEIPKNFSSMVAIGAMANNVAVSQDISNFKQHNEGLKDRIITHSPRKNKETESKPRLEDLEISQYSKTPAKNNINYTYGYVHLYTNTPSEWKYGDKTYNRTEYNELKIFWENHKKAIASANKAEEERLKTLYNAFYSIYFNSWIVSKNINPLQSFLMGKSKDIQKEDYNNNYIDTPFFLPYNVSLDMDGLSGMTLYQKFKTTKTIFPSDYETKNMNLVVNSLNHNITPQSWITQISAIPHPEPELKSKETSKPHKKPKHI